LSIDLYGIILAGGKSSRMGTNKSLLPVKGKPMIQHIALAVRSICRETWIVTNDPESYTFIPDVRLTCDLYPGKGPLAGIHAGLSALPLDSYGFVMACDMPIVSRPLVDQMCSMLPGPDAVVYPGQPFHGIYHTRLVPMVEEMLQNDRLRMDSLLQQVNVAYLSSDSADPISFNNLNTPEDYERYLRSL
jgi:molybdopterin-guanine dinucleotide biosynthesis protein A